MAHVSPAICLPSCRQAIAPSICQLSFQSAFPACCSPGPLTHLVLPYAHSRSSHCDTDSHDSEAVISKNGSNPEPHRKSRGSPAQHASLPTEQTRAQGQPLAVREVEERGVRVQVQGSFYRAESAVGRDLAVLAAEWLWEERAGEQQGGLERERGGRGRGEGGRGPPENGSHAASGAAADEGLAEAPAAAALQGSECPAAGSTGDATGSHAAPASFSQRTPPPPASPPPPLRVLDVMSGSGVRGARYLLQSPAGFVWCNDASVDTHAALLHNLKRAAAGAGAAGAEAGEGGAGGRGAAGGTRVDLEAAAAAAAEAVGVTGEQGLPGQVAGADGRGTSLPAETAATTAAAAAAAAEVGATARLAPAATPRAEGSRAEGRAAGGGQASREAERAAVCGAADEGELGRPPPAADAVPLLQLQAPAAAPAAPLAGFVPWWQGGDGGERRGEGDRKWQAAREGKSGRETEQWRVTHEDGMKVLFACYQSRSFFDIVDVDSFGSDTHFLGPALQAVARGGLLYATSTDGFCAAGHAPARAVAAYGAFVRPLPFCNELGLRTLIGAAMREAALRRLRCSPVFSLFAPHGPVFRAMLRVEAPGGGEGRQGGGGGGQRGGGLGATADLDHYNFIAFCHACGSPRILPWEALGAALCPCGLPGGGREGRSSSPQAEASAAGGAAVPGSAPRAGPGGDTGSAGQLAELPPAGLWGASEAGGSGGEGAAQHGTAAGQEDWDRAWPVGTQLHRMGLRPMAVVGPLYTGPLHSAAALRRMQQHAQHRGWRDACRTLSLMLEESDPRLPPWFFKIDQVAKRSGVPTPPRQAIAAALHERGFLAARSHVDATALKTDCPLPQLVAIVRQAGGKQ